MSVTYDVWLENAPPQTLSEIAKRVAAAWVLFALGITELGGRSVKYPTGRMAANIRIEQKSPVLIAIIADTPEAEILEEGHGPIDLKNYMKGRAIPLHRGRPGHYGSAGYGAPVIAGSDAGPRVFTTVRAQGATGIRTVGDTGWVIPEFKPYSPAMYLAEMIANREFG